MSTILIALLIAVYTLQSLLCRKYSEHYPGEEDMASPVFTIVSGFVVAMVCYAFTDFSFQASALTVFLGLLNAVALFGYNGCMIKASQSGPYSILMVFMIAGGIIIPTLTAAIGFREYVSIGKIICILVVIIAVYMTSCKEENSVFTDKKVFLFSCVGLAACNGLYGMFLDVQQRLTTAAQKEEMVGVTYFCAMLLSVIYLLSKKQKIFIHIIKQNKKSCTYLISCSIVVALAINLFVYTLPLVNLAVLYTLDNSGVFLVSVLISRIFFKEKMSVINWLGCGVMCAALVGVSVL